MHYLVGVITDEKPTIDIIDGTLEPYDENVEVSPYVVKTREQMAMSVVISLCTVVLAFHAGDEARSVVLGTAKQGLDGAGWDTLMGVPSVSSLVHGKGFAGDHNLGLPDCVYQLPVTGTTVCRGEMGYLLNVFVTGINSCDERDDGDDLVLYVTTSAYERRAVEMLRTYDVDAFYREYLRIEKPSLDDDGNECSTFNPQSKWDWYVIGGRWLSYLGRYNDYKTRLDYCDDPSYHDQLNDWTVCRLSELDGLIGATSQGKDWFYPSKVITPDGEWHESDPWNDIDDVFEDDKEWVTRFHERFIDRYPDGWFTVVDIHD